MGGHPLRSPTRRCLGRPLPYQPADGPQAPPKAAPLRVPLERGSQTPRTACGISSPFELLFPTSGQVTYVLRTHSPLSPALRPNCVRLACLKHAASVHPEPGSNSPSEIARCFAAPGDHLSATGHRRQPDRRAVQSSPFQASLTTGVFPITLQLLRCRAPDRPAPERTDSTTPPTRLSSSSPPTDEKPMQRISLAASARWGRPAALLSGFPHFRTGNVLRSTL